MKKNKLICIIIKMNLNKLQKKVIKMIKIYISKMILEIKLKMIKVLIKINIGKKIKRNLKLIKLKIRNNKNNSIQEKVNLIKNNEIL